MTTLTGKDGPIGTNDPTIRPDDLKNVTAANNKGLEEKLHQLSKIVTAQQSHINALTAKPAKAEKPKIPSKAVTVDKKKYMFNLAQFRMPEYGLVTAEQAAADPEIMKALVDMNSGVIREHFGK